jgi:ParB family transcriptional regulator, chromosome partitioning protein
VTEPHPSIRLSDIRKGERFRRDLGDIDALATSIATVGLLHPIVVTSDSLLVAGERRLAAVSKLGWTRVPVRIIDPPVLLMAEQDENAQRLPFTPSEAAAIAKALMPAAKAAAKARMEAGTPSSETDKGRADEQVARAVGMGRTALRQATEVVAAAAEDPTLSPLVEHMDETGKVEPAHRALKALPPDPTPEDVKAALASRDAAYDANFPGWREEEAARVARMAWLDTWSAIRKAIAKSPASVVDVLEREDLDDLPHQLADTRAWLDAVDEAMRATTRPRLVGGAS